MQTQIYQHSWLAASGAASGVTSSIVQGWETAERFYRDSDNDLHSCTVTHANKVSCMLIYELYI